MSKQHWTWTEAAEAMPPQMRRALLQRFDAGVQLPADLVCRLTELDLEDQTQGDSED